MKKLSCFLLLGSLIALFGCSMANQEPDATNCGKINFMATASEDELEHRYLSIVVDDYLERYPNIFGESVQIFDDFSYVIDLLESFSTMNFQELRDWCSENGFYSSVIESNIIYDSVFHEIGEKYGYDTRTEEIPEQYVDNIFEEFNQRMIEEHPEYCWEDEEYGLCANTYGCISDFESLVNDKGIFIVDKVVYKLQQGYLITCPIDKYILLPECDIENLIIAYETDMLNGLSVEDLSMGPVKPIQHFVEHDMKSHMVECDGYKLSVYTTAYPVWSWFKTNTHGKVIITNTYRGKKFISDIRGEAYFKAIVQYKNKVSEDLSFFEDKRFFAHGKQITYHAYYQGSTYTPTKRTYVTIHDVNINMKQHSVWGVTVSCSHKN